jgi:sec-independent protein translocase protein TatA
MPQVGPLEILVVLVVALIAFGPEKLPGMARTVGRTLTQLRQMADEVKGEFQAGLDDPVEPDKPPPVSTEEPVPGPSSED